MMTVQVPAGMVPGMMLQVAAPDGAPVQFQIPPGATPGTMLNIPVPIAAAPPVPDTFVKPQQSYPVAQPVVVGAAPQYGVAPQTVVMTTTTTTTQNNATPMRTESYCGPLSWFIGICFFWPIVFCPVDQRQVPMRQVQG